jgi:hypothetical protein
VRRETEAEKELEKEWNNEGDQTRLVERKKKKE